MANSHYNYYKKDIKVNNMCSFFRCCGLMSETRGGTRKNLIKCFVREFKAGIVECDK